MLRKGWYDVTRCFGKLLHKRTVELKAGIKPYEDDVLAFLKSTQQTFIIETVD